MQRTHINAWLALAAIGSAAAAAAQNDAPGEGAGWTGLTEAEEIIEARRVLMLQTEELMKPIDAFTAGADADPAALKAAAATIEAMLLALPHLFPPTTDLYDPAELEQPTIALPALWQDFGAFRELAAAGEAAAAAMVEAESVEALRSAARTLRTTCDGCHARFTESYTPPVVTEQDLEFDFESVFPED